MEHILQDKIAAIISPSLTEMGYDIVQVKMIESGRRTLQIMAERHDEKMMTVDDCADISHTVSALLDVEDPIQGAYHLEVSSPGIDRPLVKLQDFSRFIGFEIKLETKLTVDARKRFKGKIIAVEGENIQLSLDQNTTTKIPFSMVRSAKLLLTDELIKAAQEQQTQQT